MGFLFMSVQKKRVLAVISASIIMSAIRTVIVSFFMEKNVSGINAYYLPENLAVLGFAALAALFLAVFVFSAVKLGRKKRLVLENGSASISVGSLIFAFTLIGEAIIYIYSIVIGESEIRSLGVVIFALTVICAVSFLFNVQSSCSKKRSKTVLGLLALLPILLSAFRLLGDFIRTQCRLHPRVHITLLVLLRFCFILFVRARRRSRAEAPPFIISSALLRCSSF